MSQMSSTFRVHNLYFIRSWYFKALSTSLFKSFGTHFCYSSTDLRLRFVFVGEFGNQLLLVWHPEYDIVTNSASRTWCLPSHLQLESSDCPYPNSHRKNFQTTELSHHLGWSRPQLNFLLIFTSILDSLIWLHVGKTVRIVPTELSEFKLLKVYIQSAAAEYL